MVKILKGSLEVHLLLPDPQVGNRQEVDSRLDKKDRDAVIGTVQKDKELQQFHRMGAHALRGFLSSCAVEVNVAMENIMTSIDGGTFLRYLVLPQT